MNLSPDTTKETILNNARKNLTVVDYVYNYYMGSKRI